MSITPINRHCEARSAVAIQSQYAGAKRPVTSSVLYHLSSVI
jgi:hypothetical protein